MTNLPFPSGTSYFSGYSTATQSVVSTNVFQNILINTTGLTNSWSNSNGTLTVPATGIYLIHYTGQISATTGPTLFSFRATANAIEISGSEAALSGSTSSIGQVSQSFVTSLAQGNSLLFQFTANLTGGSLTTGGATTVKPTFTCTIVRIQ